ncbi:GNAT family N-acetyltransferase [Frankia sp. Cpl3]|uniref:GNAT family N-acetyltransferase n=1 Tax=Parafrankia colletiae TaxID=573497 RepID=UPI000AAE7485|nr:GNAT family protein [Parafrankia colletiae]MCK9900502.1 GNAT family N-acetyltransferase [Frankia sp. Cpl3]
MSELRTGRLVLRPVARTDEVALRALWNQPDVRRFLFDGRPVTAEQIAGLVGDSIAAMAAHGWGLWVLLEPRDEDEDSARLVGAAGSVAWSGGAGVELWCSLDPACWGQGFAREAAAAILDHAFGPVGLGEVLVEVDEENAASLRLVHWLGAAEIGVRPGDLGPLRVFRLSPGHGRPRLGGGLV